MRRFYIGVFEKFWTIKPLPCLGLWIGTKPKNFFPLRKTTENPGLGSWWPDLKWSLICRRSTTGWRCIKWDRRKCFVWIDFSRNLQLYSRLSRGRKSREIFGNITKSPRSPASKAAGSIQTFGGGLSPPPNVWGAKLPGDSRDRRVGGFCLLLLSGTWKCGFLPRGFARCLLFGTVFVKRIFFFIYIFYYFDRNCDFRHKDIFGNPLSFSGWEVFSSFWFLPFFWYKYISIRKNIRFAKFLKIFVLG